MVRDTNSDTRHPQAAGGQDTVRNGGMMPIYEYRCDEGHEVDVMQSITEPPLEKCPECGAPTRRVLHSTAIHFKGSGFHNTDYGTRSRAKSGDGSDGGGSDSSGSGSPPCERSRSLKLPKLLPLSSGLLLTVGRVRVRREFDLVTSSSFTKACIKVTSS